MSYKFWLFLQPETNYTIIIDVAFNMKITFYRKCILNMQFLSLICQNR